MHRPFERVPHDGIVIRRYMRLSSFLVLLSGNLVQVRADAYQDAAEGAYGLHNVRFSLGVRRFLKLPPEASNETVVRNAREHTLCTCWYEGEYESFAMWNVFGLVGEAVAIETTVGALRAVLRDLGGLRVERVRYEPMEGLIEDVPSIFFRKRWEYEYEHEVRTVQVLPERVGSRIYNQAIDLNDKNQLIKKIIIGPQSNPMLRNSIETAVSAIFSAAKMTFDGDIVPSALDADIVPQDGPN